MAQAPGGLPVEAGERVALYLDARGELAALPDLDLVLNEAPAEMQRVLAARVEPERDAVVHVDVVQPVVAAPRQPVAAMGPQAVLELRVQAAPDRLELVEDRIGQERRHGGDLDGDERGGLIDVVAAHEQVRVRAVREVFLELPGGAQQEVLPLVTEIG